MKKRIEKKCRAQPQIKPGGGWGIGGWGSFREDGAGVSMVPDQLITRKPCPSCPAPSPSVAAAEYAEVGSKAVAVASLGVVFENGVEDIVGRVGGIGGTLIGGGAGREETGTGGKSDKDCLPDPESDNELRRLSAASRGTEYALAVDW